MQIEPTKKFSFLVAIALASSFHLGGCGDATDPQDGYGADAGLSDATGYDDDEPIDPMMCKECQPPISEINCWPDSDHDGYGDSKKGMKQYDEFCPAGYSTWNTDCNDADPQVHRKISCYDDNDGDGLGAGSAKSICAASCPAGTSTSNADCDDNNASITQSQQECYTDNDGDGKGGSLASACSASCGSGRVTNSNDCGSADYCFEKTGTLDLKVTNFRMSFTDKKDNNTTMSGSEDDLTSSRIKGSVNSSGTLSFNASDFKISYSFVESGVQVTALLTANSAITSNIDPKTGDVSSLKTNVKMAFSFTYKGKSYTCVEASMPVEFYSTVPYNSENGTLTLQSKTFTIDKTTKPNSTKSGTVCGSLNSIGNLPGTGNLLMTVKAKTSSYPVSSWPEL
jgi:hypothetical protein